MVLVSKLFKDFVSVMEISTNQFLNNCRFRRLTPPFLMFGQVLLLAGRPYEIYGFCQKSIFIG